MPTTGWWEVLWPDPATVLHAVGLAPGMDVIDLCCGDGWFTLPIAKIAGRVVAIDLDPKLLDVAQGRLAAAGASNCECVAGSAYDVAKLVTEPVDFVFMANVFHGVPERLRLALAVHEALKPSGRLAIVNWHRRPRGETIILGEPRGPRTDLRLSPSETIACVEPAGLSLLRVDDVPPFHYAAVFARPLA